MKKFKKPESGPSGRCVAGIHAVHELLSVRPKSVKQFWLREKYSDNPALEELFTFARRRGVKVHIQAVGALDKILPSHQGVVAFSDEDPEVDWPALQSAEKATLLALDEVEDPHNLGAVLRTAWLLGAQAVLTPEHRAAGVSAAVSKVAQGAVEHVPVVRDSALPQQLLALKEHGFWVLGLAHNSKQSLFAFEIPEKVVWVLGSEAGGLRKSVAGACDDFIAIPQIDARASYNVSVAAAIALAETARQRKVI